MKNVNIIRPYQYDCENVVVLTVINISSRIRIIIILSVRLLLLLESKFLSCIH